MNLKTTLTTIIATLAGLLETLAAASDTAGRAAATLQQNKEQREALLLSVTEAPDASGDGAALAEMGKINAAIELAEAVLQREAKRRDAASDALKGANKEAVQQVRAAALAYRKSVGRARLADLKALVTKWLAKDGETLEYGPSFDSTAKEAIERIVEAAAARNRRSGAIVKKFVSLPDVSAADGAMLDAAREFLSILEAEGYQEEPHAESSTPGAAQEVAGAGSAAIVGTPAAVPQSKGAGALLAALDAWGRKRPWAGKAKALQKALPKTDWPADVGSDAAALEAALEELAVSHPLRVTKSEDGWCIAPAIADSDDEEQRTEKPAAAVKPAPAGESDNFNPPE